MKVEPGDLDELPDEVDFTNGVRGKYAGRLGRDILTVTLDADVAKVFSTAAEVNDALRLLIKTSTAVDPRLERKAS